MLVRASRRSVARIFYHFGMPTEIPSNSVAPDRATIAAHMREGLAQFSADPNNFRTLTREELLREDIFDRP